MQPDRRLLLLSSLVASLFAAPVPVRAQPPAASEYNSPICPGAPFVNHLPKGAVADSPWVKVGGRGFAVCPVKGRSDLWAAQCTWAIIHTRPKEIFRLEQADSLFALGEIQPETMLTLLSLRFPVAASSFEEARTRARSTRPLDPPKDVERELRRRLKAAQRGRHATPGPPASNAAR